MSKIIVFTHHAEFKLVLLTKHGFKITKQQIKAILKEPNRICPGYAGRKIAERQITNMHLLRVVFEESSSEIKVITLYPGRRDRYETEL
jgi:hypothetical protein